MLDSVIVLSVRYEKIIINAVEKIINNIINSELNKNVDLIARLEKFFGRIFLIKGFSILKNSPLSENNSLKLTSKYIVS